LAEKWEKIANDYWNDNFGENFWYELDGEKYKVVFDAKFVADPDSSTWIGAWWSRDKNTDEENNYVYVLDDPKWKETSFVMASSIQAFRGQWSSGAPDWVVAHETGHFYWLPDNFTYRGQGQIMSYNPHLLFNTRRVHQDEVNRIIGRKLEELRKK